MVNHLSLRETARSDSGNECVKKHVAAIHTDGSLSLLERKTANVLLLNAYDNLVSRRTHKLPTKILCAMLGWDESNNLHRLQDVLRRLASTPIEFNIMEDGEEVWRVMSIISFGEISKGFCTYRYDEYLAERLFEPEVYATINIGVQRRFEGGYALALYENCLRYKAVGSTGWWAIDRFRKIIGALAPMYDEFKYLKRDVIVKPVDEINRISDLHLVTEYKKLGRRVSEVRFLITESPQQTLLKPDVLDEHVDIRNSEIYQRLRDHGIGERLAIFWVMQDETRARAVVDYVEKKDKKQQVKGSTAGYIRTLIEREAEVGNPAYEEKKRDAANGKAKEVERQANEEQRKERELEFKKAKTSEVLHALSVEEKRALALEYITQEGAAKAKSYDETTLEFKNPIERLQYTTWLRLRLAPKTSKAEFAAWLKAKEGAKTSADT